MSLVISDEILQSAPMSENEFMQEIVLMLFRQNQLSIGKASRILGMHLIQFQHLFASRDIGVHYDVADFKEDLNTIWEMYGE